MRRALPRTSLRYRCHRRSGTEAVRVPRTRPQPRPQGPTPPLRTDHLPQPQRQGGTANYSPLSHSTLPPRHRASTCAKRAPARGRRSAPQAWPSRPPRSTPPSPPSRHQIATQSSPPAAGPHRPRPRPPFLWRRRSPRPTRRARRSSARTRPRSGQAWRRRSAAGGSWSAGRRGRPRSATAWARFSCLGPVREERARVEGLR